MRKFSLGLLSAIGGALAFLSFVYLLKQSPTDRGYYTFIELYGILFVITFLFGTIALNRASEAKSSKYLAFLGMLLWSVPLLLTAIGLLVFHGGLFPLGG